MKLRFLTTNEHINFQLKIILSVCSVIFLVFIVSGYFTYWMHLKIAQDEVAQQFVQTVDQIQYNVEQQITGTLRISDQIVFHPIISDTIEQVNKSDIEIGLSFQQRMVLNELLNQMMVTHPQLLSLTIFDLYDQQYSPPNSFLVQNINEQGEQLIVEQLEGSDGELVWFSTPLSSLVGKTNLDLNIITAARWMKNEQLETYGVLVLIFHERYFGNELQKVIRTEQGRSFLYNAKGELLYSDGTVEEIEIASQLYNDQQNKVQHYGDESFLLAKSKSERYSFTLIAQTSLDHLSERSAILFRITFISALIGIIFASGILIIVLRGLFRPMRRLVKGMRKVRAGKMDTRINTETKDEFSFLGETFNSMLDELNSLISEVYEKQLYAREAELKALQAQLNPHFLYNTLDMIYWKLYLKDDDTASLIISLSELLRYSLGPSSKETTIREEIQQLNNYLIIQKSRFEDSLHIEIMIEDEVQESIIIPLLLQPLVENVFKHAFQRNAIHQDELVIRAWKEQDQLLIEISDNGVGMPSELVKNINVNLSKEQNEASLTSTFLDEEQETIGIRSVIRRIEIAYGPPSRLEIVSTEGEGVTMRLILPYRVRSERLEG